VEASRRRRLQGRAVVILFLFAAGAVPALAATESTPSSRSSTSAATRRLLTVTAVRTSYSLSGLQSDTNTASVTQTVRWDLVKIVQRTVLAGGENAGKDVATRDTVTLTGSGDARPDAFSAAGGGTFVLRQHDRHRHADDRGRDGRDDRDDRGRNDHRITGIYVVTGFVDWRPAGGTLDVADGIGRRDEASAGTLTLAVRLFPAGGGHHDGVLTVNARLRNETFDVDGGITLAVDGFFFVQDEGNALFHVPRD